MLYPTQRQENCGTIEATRARQQTLEPGIAEAVQEAIELARYDLDDPIDAHLTASLDRRGLQLPN